MFPRVALALRAPWIAAAASLAIAFGLATSAGCGGGSAAPGTGGGSSSSSTTGGAGGSGPPMHLVCQSSPAAAPFGGSDACPAPMPPALDALDEALAAGGLDRCNVRFLQSDVSLSGWSSKVLLDKHRLPDFTPLHAGPLRLPAYGRETRAMLDAALDGKAPVSDTIAALSLRRGHALDKVCVDLAPFDPDPMDTTPLATAVLLLDEHLGKPGDEAALRAAAAPVPIDLQRRLAPVIGALDHAVAEVRAALGTSNPTALRHLATAYALYAPDIAGYDTSVAGIAALDAVDLNRIVDASAVLARTIEQAGLDQVPDAMFAAFEAQTPAGNILVHGSGTDTYKKGTAADKALLLFDLGGDDVYEVGAGASTDKLPVSVAIDVRGKDSYGYAVVPSPLDADLLPSDSTGRYNPPTTPDMGYGPITLSRVPRQGVGLGGIGMLFDLGTEGDVYRSLAVSQGFAAMGVGVLYDAGGDDDYAAEVAAQGSAVYGVAALIDRGGNDKYQSFSFSQGFGGAEGAGALVDGDGDDTYLVDVGDPAVGGHPLYFTPQLPGKGNSSMSQGTAMGRRPASSTDVSYMAGGVGILRDRHGHDAYTGSVFAQAAGYWQGLGMLLDGDGADTYDALWYIQGSAAHFSLALFLDEAGDDQYNPTLTPAATSIGLGHDFSAGLHLDLGGNDHYRAPGLSLGSGNINGIGCLVNSGGDDTYEAAGDPTLGAGNYSAEAAYGDPRQAAPTIGIFVDVGGTDTYLVGGTARDLDDQTWSYEPQPYPAPMTVTTEHGCSNDANGGAVSLP